MTINRDGLTRLLITIGISIYIYSLTAILFMKTSLSFSDIMKSIFLGAGIWLISEISFEAIERKWAHSIIPSYIALFIIIGASTVCGLILFDMASTAIILIICGAAEISGLTIAIISRHIYNKKLNEKLKEFQNNH